jgi:hypothetical protein
MLDRFGTTKSQLQTISHAVGKDRKTYYFSHQSHTYFILYSCSNVTYRSKAFRDSPTVKDCKMNV